MSPDGRSESSALTTRQARTVCPNEAARVDRNVGTEEIQADFPRRVAERVTSERSSNRKHPCGFLDHGIGGVPPEMPPGSARWRSTGGLGQSTEAGTRRPSRRRNEARPLRPGAAAAPRARRLSIPANAGTESTEVRKSTSAEARGAGRRGQKYGKPPRKARKPRKTAPPLVRRGSPGRRRRPPAPSGARTGGSQAPRSGARAASSSTRRRGRRGTGMGRSGYPPSAGQGTGRSGCVCRNGAACRYGSG